jgi:hypothetical protein
MYVCMMYVVCVCVCVCMCVCVCVCACVCVYVCKVMRNLPKKKICITREA